MLKIAKAVGVTFLLPLLLVACANPTSFFLSGSTYYAPTPTPRSLTTAQAAGIVQTQLATVQGLPMQVVPDGETGLAVFYDLNAAGDRTDQDAILAVSRAVGGLIDLEYVNIERVSLFMMMGQQNMGLVEASATDIQAWYDALISDQELLNAWSAPGAAPVAPEAAPAAPEGEAVPAAPETAPAAPETAPAAPETAPAAPETAPATPETAPAPAETPTTP